MKTKFEWNKQQRELVIANLLGAIEVAITLPDAKLIAKVASSLLKKVRIVAFAEYAAEINENEELQLFFETVENHRKLSMDLTVDDYKAYFSDKLTEDQIQDLINETKASKSIFEKLSRLESDYKELTIEG